METNGLVSLQPGKSLYVLYTIQMGPECKDPLSQDPGMKISRLLFALLPSTLWVGLGSVSPVLSKCPIILLHGLDLRVLMGIFFLFHCRLHVGYRKCKYVINVKHF